MIKHRRRKAAKTPIRKVLKPFMSAVGKAKRHPIRFGSFVAISCLLLFLVITKSLSYALAPTNPDLALALNSSNPAALIAKANKIRGKILKESGSVEKNKEEVINKTIDQLPKAERTEEPESELVNLRMEIRRLARRAITSDPLNAEAFRLLAETTSDPEEVRTSMREAAKRSRRDSEALFWLLNESYYQKDFHATLGYADILLRTHPELSAYVFSYLALVAEAPEGTSVLVSYLAQQPAWRASFFNALPQHIKNADIPLTLMQALKENGKPPSNKELAPYLDFLLSKNAVESAYNVWLRFLPSDELDGIGLLTHANFERDPSGLAFDWRIGRGLNAIAEFTSQTQNAERSLHVRFGPGRIQFPEVSQIVILPAGKYRLTGKLKGSIIGKRGLRWQLRCMSGARKILGETEMLMGKAQEWRIFELEAEVALADNCRGQVLRLFHDSRSASEELLNGEAWFANLRLEHIPEVALQ